MDQSQKPPDKTLSSRVVKIERKQVTVEIRENYRGRYLKILETTHGKRNIVIIPEIGINAFNEAIDAVISDLRSL